jgi:DNA anti-recombination protein RmuC
MKETITKLEAEIQGSDINEPRKQELQVLINQLRQEVEVEAKENSSHLEEIRKGVEEFESAHPQLTALVSRISTFLSNSGI